MSIRESPTNKPHIVLLGGGHAHVLALLWLAKQIRQSKSAQKNQPYRITLVSESTHTPYSGMLPGYLCGIYRQQDCLINLHALAQREGVGWHQGRVVGIQGKTLQFSDDSELDELDFDTLSINTGATGQQLKNAEDSPHVCSVKPIENFIQWHQQLQSDAWNDIAIVGSGAAGVEMAFALQKRWHSQKPQLKIYLIGEVFLPNFPPRFQNTIQNLLQQRNIEWIEDTVVGYEQNQLQLLQRGDWAVDKVVVAMGVVAPDWVKNTDLELDDDGFIHVNDCLQSLMRADVFACGDIAAHLPPLAKSGVMATRQSLTLAKNLAAAAEANLGKPLQAWQNRTNPLYILNTADDAAVFCYHGISAYSKISWWWKNYLDTRFMNKFK